MSQLIVQIMGTMHQEYTSDKKTHWQKMATLINLIITASISCYTYAHGATEVRINQEQLENYIQTLIVPELQVADTA